MNLAERPAVVCGTLLISPLSELRKRLLHSTPDKLSPVLFLFIWLEVLHGITGDQPGERCKKCGKQPFEKGQHGTLLNDVGGSMFLATLST